MNDHVKIVDLWSDKYSSPFRSRFLFALLIHYDNSIELEEGKGPMNGVDRIIKRVACERDIGSCAIDKVDEKMMRSSRLN